MFIRSLSIPIESLCKKTEDIANFARLGIFTIKDLLLHYPRAWEDRSRIVPLSEYKNSAVSTQVTVLGKEKIWSKKSRILNVYIQDESFRAGGIHAVLKFFNCDKQPWLEKKFVLDEKYFVYGVFKEEYGEIQSSNFDASVSGKNFGKILPKYPLTSGLKMQTVRNLTEEAVKQYAKNIENELPDEIIIRDNLLFKRDAIKEMHIPSSLENIEKAKKTLIYEELFYLEIMVAKRALERRSLQKPAAGRELSVLQKKLIERLNFSLTKGQNDAVIEINKDMQNNIPMARLLQGDVGSGKTLVSFLAALLAVEKNGQAAIMAPTELLARQHAENAAKLLEPLGVKIAFLTGNTKAAGRKELLKNLVMGAVDIVIGTHALFSKDVEYKNLTLVVIDEQHRFGVTQRALIMSKGNSPGLLMMSATPIPRTLALTVFGDMDVSVIQDMPPGRKPVKTHLSRISNEANVYDAVRNELEQGRQAYFVYPLIEGAQDIKDAVSMANRLGKEIFPEYKVALIHSKLSEEEKKLTMDRFRAGEIKILAATSVVEVGVDVPNATCMVIEHAERFGLSALHQLRGRVGRGKDQSFCFLVYSDDYSEEQKKRLIIMFENSDGFIIAEEDLKMRGPGHIAGTEQSGYLVLGIANPIRDIEELQRARQDAFSILESDPSLLLANNRVIANVLEQSPPFGDVTF